MVHSRLIATVVVAIGSIVGCTSGSRQNASTSMQIPERAAQPATQPAAQTSAIAKPAVGTRPLIDFARGAGGFPLNRDSLPASLGDLVQASTTEYRARVTLSDDATPVVASAASYPRIDTLAIDLSDGQIKSEYRPSAFKAVGRLQRNALHVDRLSYQAPPASLR